MPKCDGTHERSEAESLRALGQRCERCPTLQRGPLGMAHEAEEMIGSPQRVQPECLYSLGDATVSMLLDLDELADD